MLRDLPSIACYSEGQERYEGRRIHSENFFWTVWEKEASNAVSPCNINRVTSYVNITTFKYRAQGCVYCEIQVIIQVLTGRVEFVSLR